MFPRHAQKIILLLLIFLFSLNAQASSSYTFIIKGIKGHPLQNVQERLTILKESLGNMLSDQNIQEFQRRAPEEIREALQPYGYFKTEINSSVNHHKIVYTITPGLPITLTQIAIILTGPGKDNKVLREFVDHFPLQSGQVLKIKKYEAAKEKLFLLAGEQGYIKAVFDKKEIRINLKKYTADIVWEFNTGAQYYFGPVHFQSNEYSHAFLERFVPFQANAPFSSGKLLEFQQDLSNSPYFKEVEVTPNLTDPNSTVVPIDISVKPPKSQRYDVGIGYGTYTGPRLTLGADFRRVTPTGQHFNMEMKLSSILSALTAKYFIPGNNPLTELYTIGGNIQYFAPKNGSSFSQTLTGSYNKKLKEWENILSLNFLNEKYKVVNKPTHISQVLYPSWTLTRIKTDDPINPRFGNMFSITLKGAEKTLLSKSNFFQGEIKAKSIVSPTKNSRVILRGDLGYTIVQDLNQLPLTLRYFAGGLGSVRGYPYASIGPGKYLQVASVELQHKIVGNWNGAVFYDVGNASNTFIDGRNSKKKTSALQSENFKRGQGVGIIYRSLIGPVQLYVGQAVTKKNKPWSFEFSIGPEF